MNRTHTVEKTVVQIQHDISWVFFPSFYLVTLEDYIPQPKVLVHEGKREKLVC